ncbi:hypothetical protein LCGC14_0408260 [marine sediment metagenome]|uniref:Helicase ATP-binding domain-containing protein n=2 Tax=root TaxID=1 RepID=A0A7V1BH03_9RHOB|nr:DEAD/DEAH box helicase family protein [Sulfitobacter litoralis]HDZ53032.1 hypothetical protein [Sulfitobacter litoralis]
MTDPTSSVQTKQGVRKIYAYTTPAEESVDWLNGKGNGRVKIGHTTRSVAERIREQFGASSTDRTWYPRGEWDAQAEDGTWITDHMVHRYLSKRYRRVPDTEWFEVDPEAVWEAVEVLKNDPKARPKGKDCYELRGEQRAAIDAAMTYYEADPSNRWFLWNAKMRFGKTFTAFKLAERLRSKRILVLTYFPAVDDGWSEEIEDHVDFEEWQYAENGASYEDGDQVQVSFSSFQMLEHKTLGKNRENANTKADALRREIAAVNWDLVIIDEYHHGAHHPARREFVSSLKTQRILALSGTPFRAIAKGDFATENKFDWTYLDERQALADWAKKETCEANPYEELPAIHFVGYRLPPHAALTGVDGDCDLTYSPTTIFKADKDGFKNPEAVKDWLQSLSTLSGSARRAGGVPPPYHPDFTGDVLSHVLWLLPSKHSCDAMKRLLEDGWFPGGEGEVIQVSGSEGETGKPAQITKKVRDKIAAAKRSITLSVGKLTTGVTVPEWTAVFHLKAGSSLESYLQASYRCQSSGSINLRNGDREVKTNCFVFDYDPDRMLVVMGDYIKSLKGSGAPLDDRSNAAFPTVIFDDEKNGHIPLNVSDIENELNNYLLKRRPAELMSDSMRLLEDAISAGGLNKALCAQLVKAGKSKSPHHAMRDLDPSLFKSKTPGTIIGDNGKQSAKSTEVADENPKNDEIRAIKEAMLVFIKSLGHLAYIGDLREASVEDLFKVDDELFEKIMGNDKDQVREIIDGAGLDRVQLNAMIQKILMWENFEFVVSGCRNRDELGECGKWYPSDEEATYAFSLQPNR